MGAQGGPAGSHRICGTCRHAGHLPRFALCSWELGSTETSPQLRFWGHRFKARSPSFCHSAGPSYPWSKPARCWQQKPPLLTEGRQARPSPQARVTPVMASTGSQEGFLQALPQHRGPARGTDRQKSHRPHERQ